MAEAKTKPTGMSVEGYLAGIADDGRRSDCRELVTMMAAITGEPPVMWGTSIVGFGAYAYDLAGGRKGSSCRVGFSSRKTDISVYLVASGPDQPSLLKRLGKHKMAKACLRIRRLADVDLEVLADLIRDAISEVRRRYD